VDDAGAGMHRDGGDDGNALPKYYIAGTPSSATVKLPTTNLPQVSGPPLTRPPRNGSATPAVGVTRVGCVISRWWALGHRRDASPVDYITLAKVTIPAARSATKHPGQRHWMIE